ncbi:MAG: glycosyltransferase [Candidatus Caenarcaniphilales bacterium]|nr:glycosyltransferase [Candidatus Caenarcaniphilales bacterium]
MTFKKILFLTSPAGPIGSGEGGGVETNLINLAPLLNSKGYEVAIIAPEGSIEFHPNIKIYQVPGVLPVYACTAEALGPNLVDSEGVVRRMWQKAKELETNYDIIVGINYDWIAYYASTFFSKPVGHIISICSQIKHVDEIIGEIYKTHPSRLAVNTLAQGETFGFGKEVVPLYGGINVHDYEFNLYPQRRLSWVARISPEKGLEDAFEVSQFLGLPLDICGKMQDTAYFESIINKYPKAEFVYHGFKSQAEVAEIVKNSMAMLMTPHWVEAFGNTCIEAMACGTPVIAYNQGGPSEIINDGLNGFLVETKNTKDLIAAVEKAQTLNRFNARLRAFDFTLEKMAERYLDWMGFVIAADRDSVRVS